MDSFDLHLRTRVVFGNGAFERLGDLSRKLGFAKTLIVTDSGMVAGGLVDRRVVMDWPPRNMPKNAAEDRGFDALTKLGLESPAHSSEIGPNLTADPAGGIPEVVQEGQTGRRVPPRDETALAAAIVGMLGDAATRQAFGNAGHARVLDEFSVEQLVAGTVVVYESRLMAQAAYGFEAEGTAR